MDKKEIKKAFIDTVPVMTGYLVLGIGFGIILKTKGFGVLWALAMSTVIYAGSMQFVAIDLMTGGASLAVTALTTLMVNARHLFYGISMVDRYKGAGKKKPYMIYALTDETYSLVCGEESRYRYYFTVSLLDQIYWVTGSVCGSLLGSVIPFNTEGIDFALRFLPFLIFGGVRKTPAYITYLGKVLPYAIMAMLVVFCLKNVSLVTVPYGLPELISCALVVLLHVWKRNTLLSIIGGTACYMLLVQLAF